MLMYSREMCSQELETERDSGNTLTSSNELFKSSCLEQLERHFSEFLLFLLASLHCRNVVVCKMLEYRDR